MAKDEFDCGICLELAEDAVETGCCHHIFCEKCLSGVAPCPICRSPAVESAPSHPIRRIIGRMTLPCDMCKRLIERENMTDHLKVCESRKFVCSIVGCGYSGIKNEFLGHLASTHSEDLLKKYNKLDNELNDLVPAAPPSLCDPIVATKNLAGRIARLGETGKFYCGDKLRPACTCCNGFCGPTNGCNCVSCMELDLKMRKLPKGFMVNSKGATARRGINKLFYCGCQVLQHNLFTDGYCGPTNGPNCGSCKKLDLDCRQGGRYFMLLG